MRFACMLLVLATVTSTAIAAPRRADHGNHVLPAMPVNPQYTDEQASIVTSGTIHYGLTIDGQVESHPSPDVKLVHQLKLNAD